MHNTLLRNNSTQENTRYNTYLHFPLLLLEFVDFGYFKEMDFLAASDFIRSGCSSCTLDGRVVVVVWLHSIANSRPKIGEMI